MHTRIIVDSTVDLPSELKKQVHTVPLSVRFGNDEFIDGITIDHKTFYEKLSESNVLPSTSQATPDAFMAAFQAAADSGESAVVITLSSKLSGTYQSAVMAASEFENVYVVDSGSTTIGSAVLSEIAIRLADEGMDAQTIAGTLEEEKQHIVIIALVDTLEYLKKGGRISKTIAFAGNILQIKPVLSVIDGEICLLGKARGSKLGNQLLTQEIENAGGIDFCKPVMLGYTRLSDEMMLNFIKDSGAVFENHPSSLRYTTVGCVIGTHAGPGAIAVAFCKK